MSNVVFLGIGSNLGNCLQNLRNVYYKLQSAEKIKISAHSSIYKSRSILEDTQDDYLNLVIKLKTELGPLELLLLLKKTEREMGRIPSYRWGPRLIDIDILLFNNLIYEDNFLCIPHRDFLSRDFFVVPVLEIDGEIIMPGSNQKLRSLFQPGKYVNIQDKFEFKLQV